jgi:hypothetical protein
MAGDAPQRLSFRSLEPTGGLAGMTQRTRLPRPRRSKERHMIAPVDALIRRVEESAQRSNQSMDEAAKVVVEELERETSALTLRTAPLIPGCGLLVAVSGVMLKSEPTSRPLSEFFLGAAVVLAVAGFTFLARALFSYAGRRVIGLEPTLEDIEFAQRRLVSKLHNARRGGVLAGVGLILLVIGIVTGVRLDVRL